MRKMSHLPADGHCNDLCNALLIGATVHAKHPSHAVAEVAKLQAIEATRSPSSTPLPFSF